MMCSSIAALSNCLLEYRLFFLCAGVSALSLQKSKKDKKGTKFASFGMISNLMKKVSANARSRACTHTHTSHTHSLGLSRFDLCHSAPHFLCFYDFDPLSLPSSLSCCRLLFFSFGLFCCLHRVYVSVSLCLCPSRDQRCGPDQKQKKRFLAEIESPGLQAAPPRDRSRACGRHKAAP